MTTTPIPPHIVEEVARSLFDVEHREMQWSESAQHAEFMRSRDYWQEAAATAIAAYLRAKGGAQ